ncbi:hypothetical protein [Enterococcus sp. BWR-S5]|uniref:hypothetical protein n=1 Tax=Enterococcus sp. BWR-S5 TaxID=2787714 RepID=UPI0019231C7B|nr:hypothetical protein [Enterococcus sp. BWR-S5]MBL1227141.1 hypothetical protein [Enterococcus sp. BWR-S5]
MKSLEIVSLSFTDILVKTAELGITLIEILMVFEWMKKNLSIDYQDIDEDMIERIGIYNNLDEAVKNIVHIDSLSGLLEIDCDQFLELNKLMVLPESMKVISFD